MTVIIVSVIIQYRTSSIKLYFFSSISSQLKYLGSGYIVAIMAPIPFILCSEYYTGSG